MPTPAEQLAGLDLGNGWHVTELLPKDPKSTGGHFSQGYKVQHQDGNRAYLKALDFSRALAGRDPAALLRQMTTAFEYERDICRECAGLSRVVRALTDGVIYTDKTNPTSAVQYLIFEMADGDIRKHLDLIATFDIAWVLRSLHNTATGLRQLHGVGIFHQDLKPSNILVFPQNGSKIGDLGRSTCTTIPAPHDHLEFAGDLTYAPPEVLYGYSDPDQKRR